MEPSYVRMGYEKPLSVDELMKVGKAGRKLQFFQVPGSRGRNQFGRWEGDQGNWPGLLLGDAK